MINSLINLGTKFGMPRYVIFFALMQIGVLFVPEAAWTSLGVESLRLLLPLPIFVKYYVDSAYFKNAMVVFWLLSPFTLVVNTWLYTIHVNFKGYPAYLERRAKRLGERNKTSDYSLIAGVLAFMALYVWGTAIYLKEPLLLGNAVPTRNRFVMAFIQGGELPPKFRLPRDGV